MGGADHAQARSAEHGPGVGILLLFLRFIFFHGRGHDGKLRGVWPAARDDRAGGLEAEPLRPAGRRFPRRARVGRGSLRRRRTATARCRGGAAPRNARSQARSRRRAGRRRADLVGGGLDGRGGGRGRDRHGHRRCGRRASDRGLHDPCCWWSGEHRGWDPGADDHGLWEFGAAGKGACCRGAGSEASKCKTAGRDV